jgi:signal transduction histidine kinase
MRQTNIDDFLQLEEYNKELEERIVDEVNKNKEKDKILSQQNKMAAMGEMIVNIAHQWRQPLMEISSLFLPIEAKLTFDEHIEKEELLSTINKLNNITNYMSNTIDDFKNFFAKDKEKIEFELIEQINLSVNIISASLELHNIKLNIIMKKNPILIGYKNEFSQVLINIINNAKDILIQKKIKNPNINILISETRLNINIVIEDNGGGITVKPLAKIFDPFFTYEKVNGSGIGLFMSKLIIENNMSGKLIVKNGKEGAIFTIILPKD